MPAGNIQNPMQAEMHILVMELCSIDLAAALDHAKYRWNEALIRGLLRQLLQGVAACHRAGPQPCFCCRHFSFIHQCTASCSPDIGSSMPNFAGMRR